MIHGVVNFRYELTLSLVVGNLNGQRELINTIIDTGFDGFLSLPSDVILRLELPWRTSNMATLGDGSKTLFDFYTGTIIWDGQYRTIDIAESETEPLLGLAMLRRCRLQVDNIEGGIIRIESL
ncbi:MAG: clan AA aspartic protease [Prochlorotrichaceae cyanobacterium]|jgi:clan AA aspartic protease